MSGTDLRRPSAPYSLGSLADQEGWQPGQEVRVPLALAQELAQAQAQARPHEKQLFWRPLPQEVLRQDALRQEALRQDALQMNEWVRQRQEVLQQEAQWQEAQWVRQRQEAMRLEKLRQEAQSQRAMPASLPPADTSTSTSTSIMHKRNCVCRVCKANLPECTHKLQSEQLRPHCCVQYCSSNANWGCRICNVDYCNKCVPPAASLTPTPAMPAICRHGRDKSQCPGCAHGSS